MKATERTPSHRPSSPGEGAASDAALFFAERAREITEFCVQQGGKAFADWPVPTVWAYVFFHVVDRTVFVLREKGRIVAVLFCQAVPEAEQRRRTAAGEPSFQWRRSVENSDALALGQVIGQAGMLSRLAKQLEVRFPGWRRMKMLTHRDGLIVELKPAVIERMLNHGRR